MAKFTAFLAAAKERFPEDAEKLSNPRALFTDAALREKIKNDEVLGPKYAELTAGFGRRGSGGQRGEGGRREGRRGERGGSREGRRGGARRDG